jgi:hypothetical protein
MLCALVCSIYIQTRRLVQGGAVSSRLEAAAPTLHNQLSKQHAPCVYACVYSLHKVERPMPQDDDKHIALARTIYIRCIYGIFGRGITNYTVIHGAYIRSWPTLHIQTHKYIYIYICIYAYTHT